MPKADAINNTPRRSTVTLSAVAAALGEIEPEGKDIDTDRLDALRGVAPFLPVRSPDDAALALSVVSDILGDVHCYDLCEEARNARLDDVSAILEQTVRWLIEAHGARPLCKTWAVDFDEQPAKFG